MDYKNVIPTIEKQLKAYLGDKKAVIGISGGIDSAVIAVLSRNVLGKENVVGVLMPYGDQDMEDAKELISFLGIQSHEVNIKKIVDQFDFLELDQISKGNVMARTRMAILYSFANQINGLVIGTSNKSEIRIGYFTKYGDGGVDIEPIGDIYKTEIYEMAEVLGVPQKIIDKKPSAELWEGQTDEGEIGMSYEELDNVLKGNINQGTIYEKVQNLRRKSEHKRKSPPVFKINLEGEK